MCIQSVNKKRHTPDTVLRKLRRYALEDCTIWMMFLVERIFRDIYLVLLILFITSIKSNRHMIYPFRLFLFGLYRCQIAHVRAEKWTLKKINLQPPTTVLKIEEYKSSSIRKKKEEETDMMQTQGAMEAFLNISKTVLVIICYMQFQNITIQNTVR